MSDIQEYYHSSVGHCTIWGDVVDKPDWVIVSENSDYGTLTAVKRSELQKKEDTWEFKQAEKRRDEIRLMTAKAQEQLDKLTSKLVDKALIDLASRLKFNVLFGKNVDGATAGWAVTISDELKKMVKEKAPEVIKDEKDIFA